MIDLPELVRDRRAITFVLARFDHRFLGQVDLVLGRRFAVLLAVLENRAAGDQVNLTNVHLVEVGGALLMERGYVDVVLRVLQIEREQDSLAFRILPLSLVGLRSTAALDDPALRRIGRGKRRD